MVLVCHIDIESFSVLNLKKVGVYRYAQEDATEILVICWAIGDDEVSTWVPVDDLPTWLVKRMHAFHREHGGTFYHGTQVPFELYDHAEGGGEFRAHNAEFERTMLNGKPGQKIGFPQTTMAQWNCTAAKAAAHALRRKLGDVAKDLGLDHQKNEDGSGVMMQLARPRKPSKEIPEPRWTPWNTPERFEVLYHYCVDDVRTERALDRRVPDLSPRERRVWLLDQKINQRGVQVDLGDVANIQHLVAETKGKLEARCRTLTGVNPTQTAKITDWIRERYDIENLQAATVRDALKDKQLDPDVRSALRIRNLHAMKAVTKYNAIERTICDDDRLRGMFLYHGAATGRWASLIVQLQNLYRAKIKDPETAIAACVSRDLDWIRTIYDQHPMVVFSSLVRSVLVSAPAHDLLCMDYSQIEARVTAWLAGQLDVLQAFRSGVDIYQYEASKIYRKPMDMVTEDERFVGKTAVLALGFGGGKVAFVGMAKNYDVDMDEDFAEEIKVDWRAANPKIRNMWYRLEEAAMYAIMNPGKVYKTNKLMFKVEDDFLYMRLPSGRRLAYFKPEVKNGSDITFMGIDTYTRRWKRVTTWGGTLTENAVQATARDLMVHGMFNLEAEDYPIIGTVHDEVITEIPEGFGSLDEASELMCRKPKWAGDLPVVASGFRAKRYRKD